MKSSSRTGFFVLGLLLEGPLSGYDIKKLAEARFSFFWSESYGQIYPELKRLEKAGMIRSKDQGQRGRKEYSLSASGKASFVSWLNEPAAAETARYEAILKFFFSSAMSPEARERLLEEFRERQEAQLDLLKRFVSQVEDSADPFGNHGTILSAIQLGMDTYSAWIAWADRVQALSAPSRPRGPR